MPRAMPLRLIALMAVLTWFMAQNAMLFSHALAALTGHQVSAAQWHDAHYDIVLSHLHSDHHATTADTCGDCAGAHHVDIQPADPATPDSKAKSQLLLLALILPLVALLLQLPELGRPRPRLVAPHRNTIPILRRSTVLRH